MEPSSNQMVRPKHVENAVFILCVALGIEIVSDVIKSLANGGTVFVRALISALSLGVPPHLPAGFWHAIFQYLLACGGAWMFIAWIWRGVNWARITVCILFLIEILGFPPSLQSLIPSFTSSGLLDLADEIMVLTALIFLFRQDSSAWFRAQTRSKRRI